MRALWGRKRGFVWGVWGLPVLQQLIDPVGLEVFLTDYWERQPLHVARPAPPWCSALPGVEDVDTLIMLTSAGGSSDGLRLVRANGGVVTESPITHGNGGHPELADVYRKYAEGWTLVINSLQRRSASVARLAIDLRDALSHDVAVNLYFTPPQAQGFAPHVDGHDVFILQITGQKHWRVFPPKIVLPLEEQKVPVDVENPGPCLLEATVEPGHVLYIPRGFVHEGIAGDGASLHLTIGIYPYRWVDVVTEAVSIAAERDVRLRESLPMRTLSPEGISPDLEEKLNEVLRSLSELQVARETLSRLGRRKVRKSHPAPDGHFAAIDRARRLDLNTVMQRRRGVSCMVHADGGRAAVEFGLNLVAGPAAIEPALRFVASSPRFRVAELPDELTDESKLVLARRLVKEGLLTLSSAENLEE